MWNSFKILSYRKKNKLLGLAAIFFLLVSYLVAISPTMAIYTEYKGLQTMIADAQSLQAKKAGLLKEQKHYQSLFDNYSSELLKQDDYLLDQISDCCKKHQVQLSSLPLSTNSQESGFSTTTKIIKLKGGFIPLLQVLYELEYKKAVGRISSVKFYLEKDYRNLSTSLFAIIYIQSLQMQPEDKNASLG